MCVFVCTYTCMYIRIHVHTYIYIHIHTYISMYIHVYTYIHIHTYTCIYMYIRVYTYLYIHIHTHTCMAQEKKHKKTHKKDTTKKTQQKHKTHNVYTYMCVQKCVYIFFFKKNTSLVVRRLAHSMDCSEFACCSKENTFHSERTHSIKRWFACCSKENTLHSARITAAWVCNAIIPYNYTI